jgi:hypothetical protein
MVLLAANLALEQEYFPLKFASRSPLQLFDQRQYVLTFLFQAEV